MYGLNYDELILGIGGGRRILFNDTKPDFPALETAKSIVLKRNSGTLSEAIKQELESNFSVEREIESGSTAESFLIKNNNSLAVRKILMKNNPVSPFLLKYQAIWFQTVGQFFPKNVPELLNYSSHNDFEILDTRFIEDVILMGNFIDSKSIQKSQAVFAEMLDLVFSVYNKSEAKSEAFIGLKATFESKAIPSVASSISKLQKFLEQNQLLNIDFIGQSLNTFVETDYLVSRLSKLISKFDRKLKRIIFQKSIIHGDLTLENVGISDRIILFDPIGIFAEANSAFDRIHLDSSFQILDASRIWLSTNFCYHKLGAASFKFHRNEMYIDFDQYIQNDKWKSLEKSLITKYEISSEQKDIFSLINILTCARILKYKVDKNPEQALILLFKIQELLATL